MSGSEFNENFISLQRVVIKFRKNLYPPILDNVDVHVVSMVRNYLIKISMIAVA